MLTIFLLILGLSSATAERPVPPRTGNLEFGGAYSYFTSSANYDLTSAKVAVPNGGGLSTNAGVASAQYDFSGRFRVYGAMTYAATSTTDGFYDRNNGSLTEIPLGAQYFGALDKFLWVVQGDAALTLYKVSEAADTAAIAEGANRVRGGGWLIYRGGSIQPFVNLAGEYRDGGRSALIPYAAGAHVKLDNFWIQLEARGALAFGNDSDSATVDRARREAYLRRVNGGSFRYYAVNPTLHEIALEAGVRVNQFNVYAGASTTFMGTSTAQGFGILAGVRFTMPTARKTSNVSTYAGPTDESGFAPKEESYDDTLFNDRPNVRKPTPVAAPPPTPAPSPSPAPKVRLIRRKKPNRKQERQQQNLNKLLNDTEQGLEGN